MVLLRKGYITRYLNERLSMGLAAESLEGYFTQRTRWCRGALQTLFLKEGPLGPGLSFLQRLFFFPLDWLVQYPVRLLGIIVPIVFLWTGVGPFIITSLDEMLSYQLPVVHRTRLDDEVLRSQLLCPHPVYRHFAFSAVSGSSPRPCPP